MMSFNQMQSQMQSQGLALSPEVKVGPFATRVSTKESCANPSGQDPETGDSDKCGLYVNDNPPWLVVVGRVYKGSMTVNNIPLGNDQVKVGVEQVRDADAHVPIPTQEVQLVRQTLNIFLTLSTHLVKPFLEHVFHCVFFYNY